MLRFVKIGVKLYNSKYYSMDDLSVDQTESCLDSTTDIDNFEYTNFSTDQEHEYRMLCKRIQETTTQSKQLTLQYMEVTKQQTQITKQKQLEIDFLKLKLRKIEEI